jgi:hypothetical protein
MLEIKNTCGIINFGVFLREKMLREVRRNYEWKTQG